MDPLLLFGAVPPLHPHIDGKKFYFGTFFTHFCALWSFFPRFAPYPLFHTFLFALCLSSLHLFFFLLPLPTYPIHQRPFTRGSVALSGAGVRGPAGSRSSVHPKRTYPSTNLRLAKQAVEQLGFSIRKAATLYEVPTTTLHRHLRPDSHLYGDDHPHIGVEGALTRAEELFIVEIIVHSATAGFPMSVPQLQEALLAQFPGRVDGRGERWLASEKWIHRFLHRHADRIHLAECNPVKHTPAQADQHLAVSDTYTKWNRFLRNQKPNSPLVFAYDETNVNLTAASAAHQKVLAPVGTRPVLYLSDQDRYLTLAIFICEDGSVVCPTLLHPQEKRIPPENMKAWDDHCGMDDTLHIAAGRTAFMNNYYFHLVFTNFADTVRSIVDYETPVVCLLDGCSSHYNPRTALELMDQNIFLFVYQSQITKYVAPPDDEAVFGAFQRARRRELGRTGGASSLAVGIAGAARAFATTLRPTNIRSAFQHRGFALTEDRLQQQYKLKQRVLLERRSMLWLQEQQQLPAHAPMFRALPFRRFRPSGRHLAHARHPLGPDVPPTGIINGRRLKLPLIRELERRVAAKDQ